jgi:hypothetical protein
LGLSLFPSIASGLITTKALAYIDSQVPRPIPAADALYDLLVVNDSQPNVLYLNKGNGVFQDVTAVAGLNSAGNQVMGSDRLFFNISPRQWLRGSIGTTENFIRIGHSLLALILALVGGKLSQYLHSRDGGRASRRSTPEVPLSANPGE